MYQILDLVYGYDFYFDGVTVKTCSLSQLCSEILERGVDRIVTLLALVICCHSRQYKETFGLSEQEEALTDKMAH